MFLQFIGSLILLTVVFQFMLAVVALPLSIFTVLASRGEASSRAYYWSMVSQQVLVSIVYAGLPAVAAHVYSAKTSLVQSILYALTGFVVTWFTLAQNAEEKAQRVQEGQPWTVPGRQGVAFGALMGAVAGLCVYPVLFLWPQTISVVPGAVPFYGWVIRLADWLTGFWIVNVILFIAAIGYLFNTGFAVLIMSLMLIRNTVAGLNRLFRSPTQS